jgi:hypothetical protein
MRRFLLGLACGAIVGACSSPSATDPVLFDPDGNLLVPRMVKTVATPAGQWHTLPNDTRVWAPQSQIAGFWPED